LGDYLPWIASSPYHASLTLSEILAHQSGLKPFVPFYQNLMDGDKLKPGVAMHEKDSAHTLCVADGMYINVAYQDSIIKWILATPQGTRGKYLYSDMGMYLLKRVIEKVAGMPMDVFLRQQYYAPLGLSTLGYNPLERFEKDRIMPTEDDKVFRKQQVQGHVHDPGAAMMGGVAGHAGLFSDANDLAIVLQMLMDGGTYGGKRYLKRATVDRFTKCRFAPEWRARATGAVWAGTGQLKRASPASLRGCQLRELWPHRFYRHSDMGRSARPFHLRFP
jgi:beta-N-acetylhexosaminidase